jgi:probable phosphoglycerate mutase
MTDFWLIRHASTSAPSDRLAGWAPDVHLSDRGRKQVQLLAARLQAVRALGTTFDEVYSSPLERTRETAEPLAAALGCAAYALSELGELNFGSWTERQFAELDQDQEWQRFNRFRSGTTLPGGGSFSSVQARAVEALLMLRTRHPEQSVIIVSHADVIKAVVMHFLGIPTDYCHRLDIEQASITRLELSRDHARISRLNDTSHLDELGAVRLEDGLETAHDTGVDPHHGE